MTAADICFRCFLRITAVTSICFHRIVDRYSPHRESNNVFDHLFWEIIDPDVFIREGRIICRNLRFILFDKYQIL